MSYLSPGNLQWARYIIAPLLRQTHTAPLHFARRVGYFAAADDASTDRANERAKTDSRGHLVTYYKTAARHGVAGRQIGYRVVCFTEDRSDGVMSVEERIEAFCVRRRMTT